MTPQQSRCLDVIKDYISEHGISPSYIEIIDTMGLTSKSHAHRLVHALAKLGHIEIRPYDHRSIHLVSDRQVTATLNPSTARLLKAHAAEYGENANQMATRIIEVWATQRKDAQ